MLTYNAFSEILLLIFDANVRNITMSRTICECGKGIITACIYGSLLVFFLNNMNIIDNFMI